MISKNAEKVLINLSFAVIVFILAMFVAITFRLSQIFESMSGVPLDKAPTAVYNVGK